MFNGYNETPLISFNEFSQDREKKQENVQKWTYGHDTGAQPAHCHLGNRQSDFWSSKSNFLGLSGVVNIPSKCNCSGCYSSSENQSYQGDSTRHRPWLPRTFQVPVNGSNEPYKLPGYHQWDNVGLSNQGTCFPESNVHSPQYLQENGGKHSYYRHNQNSGLPEGSRGVITSAKNPDKKDFLQNNEIPSSSTGQDVPLLIQNGNRQSMFCSPSYSTARNLEKKVENRNCGSNFCDPNEKYSNVDTYRQHNGVTSYPIDQHISRLPVVEPYLKAVPSNLNQNRVPSTGHRNVKENLPQPYIDQTYNNSRKIICPEPVQTGLSGDKTGRAVYPPGLMKDGNASENFHTGPFHNLPTQVAIDLKGGGGISVDYSHFNTNRDTAKSCGIMPEIEAPKLMLENSKHPEFFLRNSLASVTKIKSQTSSLDNKKNCVINAAGPINTAEHQYNNLSKSNHISNMPKYLQVGNPKNVCEVFYPKDFRTDKASKPEKYEHLQSNAPCFQRNEEIIKNENINVHGRLPRSAIIFNDPRDSHFVDRVQNSFTYQNSPTAYRNYVPSDYSCQRYNTQNRFEYPNVPHSVTGYQRNDFGQYNHRNFSQQIPQCGTVEQFIPHSNNAFIIDSHCQQAANSEKVLSQQLRPTDMNGGKNEQHSNTVFTSPVLQNCSADSLLEKPLDARKPTYLETIRSEEVNRNGTSKISPLRLLRKKKFNQSNESRSEPTPVISNPPDSAPALDVRKFWSTWAEEEEENVAPAQMVVLDCQNIDPEQAKLLHIYESDPIRTIHLESGSVVTLKGDKDTSVHPIELSESPQEIKANFSVPNETKSNEETKKQTLEVTQQEAVETSNMSGNNIPVTNLSDHSNSSVETESILNVQVETKKTSLKVSSVKPASKPCKKTRRNDSQENKVINYDSNKKEENIKLDKWTEKKFNFLKRAEEGKAADVLRKEEDQKIIYEKFLGHEEKTTDDDKKSISFDLKNESSTLHTIEKLMVIKDDSKFPRKTSLIDQDLVKERKELIGDKILEKSTLSLDKISRTSSPGSRKSDLPTSEYRRNKFLDYSENKITGNLYCIPNDINVTPADENDNLKAMVDYNDANIKTCEKNIVRQNGVSSEVLYIKKEFGGSQESVGEPNSQDKHSNEEYDKCKVLSPLDPSAIAPVKLKTGTDPQNFEIYNILNKISEIKIEPLEKTEILDAVKTETNEIDEKLKCVTPIRRKKVKKSELQDDKDERTDKLTVGNISVSKPTIKFSIQKSHDLKISFKVLNNGKKFEKSGSDEEMREHKDGGNSLDNSKNSTGLITLKYKSIQRDDRIRRLNRKNPFFAKLDSAKKNRRLYRKKKIRGDVVSCVKPSVVKIQGKARYEEEKEEKDPLPEDIDYEKCLNIHQNVLLSENYSTSDDFQVHETVDSAKIKLTFKRHKENFEREYKINNGNEKDVKSEEHSKPEELIGRLVNYCKSKSNMTKHEENFKESSQELFKADRENPDDASDEENKGCLGNLSKDELSESIDNVDSPKFDFTQENYSAEKIDSDMSHVAVTFPSTDLTQLCSELAVLPPLVEPWDKKDEENLKGNLNFEDENSERESIEEEKRENTFVEPDENSTEEPLDGDLNVSELKIEEGNYNENKIEIGESQEEDEVELIINDIINCAEDNNSQNKYESSLNDKIEDPLEDVTLQDETSCSSANVENPLERSRPFKDEEQPQPIEEAVDGGDREISSSVQAKNFETNTRNDIEEESEENVLVTVLQVNNNTVNFPNDTPAEADKEVDEAVQFGDSSSHTFHNREILSIRTVEDSNNEQNTDFEESREHEEVECDATRVEKIVIFNGKNSNECKRANLITCLSSTENEIQNSKDDMMKTDLDDDYKNGATNSDKSKSYNCNDSNNLSDKTSGDFNVSKNNSIIESDSTYEKSDKNIKQDSTNDDCFSFLDDGTSRTNKKVFLSDSTKENSHSEIAESENINHVCDTENFIKPTEKELSNDFEKNIVMEKRDESEEKMTNVTCGISVWTVDTTSLVVKVDEKILAREETENLKIDQSEVFTKNCDCPTADPNSNSDINSLVNVDPKNKYNFREKAEKSVHLKEPKDSDNSESKEDNSNSSERIKQDELSENVFKRLTHGNVNVEKFDDQQATCNSLLHIEKHIDHKMDIDFQSLINVNSNTNNNFIEDKPDYNLKSSMDVNRSSDDETIENLNVKNSEEHTQQESIIQEVASLAEDTEQNIQEEVNMENSYPNFDINNDSMVNVPTDEVIANYNVIINCPEDSLNGENEQVPKSEMISNMKNKNSDRYEALISYKPKRIHRRHSLKINTIYALKPSNRFQITKHQNDDVSFVNKILKSEFNYSKVYSRNIKAKSCPPFLKFDFRNVEENLINVLLEDIPLPPGTPPPQNCFNFEEYFKSLQTDEKTELKEFDAPSNVPKKVITTDVPLTNEKIDASVKSLESNKESENGSGIHSQAKISQATVRPNHEKYEPLPQFGVDSNSEDIKSNEFSCSLELYTSEKQKKRTTFQNSTFAKSVTTTSNIDIVIDKKEKEVISFYESKFEPTIEKPICKNDEISSDASNISKSNQTELKSCNEEVKAKCKRDKTNKIIRRSSSQSTAPERDTERNKEKYSVKGHNVEKRESEMEKVYVNGDESDKWEDKKMNNSNINRNEYLNSIIDPLEDKEIIKTPENDFEVWVEVENNLVEKEEPVRENEENVNENESLTDITFKSDFFKDEFFECESIRTSDDLEGRDVEKVSDDDKFRSIMQNCLDNAKKFLDVGNLKSESNSVDEILETGNQTSETSTTETAEKSTAEFTKDVSLLISREDVIVDDLELSEKFHPADLTMDFETSFCSNGSLNLCPEILPVDNWPYLEEEVPSSPSKSKFDEADLLPSLENNPEKNSRCVDELKYIPESQDVIPPYMSNALCLIKNSQGELWGGIENSSRYKVRRVSMSGIDIGKFKGYRRGSLIENEENLRPRSKIGAERRKSVDGVSRKHDSYSKTYGKHFDDGIKKFHQASSLKCRLSLEKLTNRDCTVAKHKGSQDIHRDDRRGKNKHDENNSGGCTHHKQDKSSVKLESFSKFQTKETVSANRKNSVYYESPNWQPKVMLLRISKSELKKICSKSYSKTSTHSNSKKTVYPRQSEGSLKREKPEQVIEGLFTLKPDSELSIKRRKSKSHSDDVITDVDSENICQNPTLYLKSEDAMNSLKEHYDNRNSVIEDDIEISSRAILEILSANDYGDETSVETKEKKTLQQSNFEINNKGIALTENSFGVVSQRIPDVRKRKKSRFRNLYPKKKHVPDQNSVTKEVNSPAHNLSTESTLVDAESVLSEIFKDVDDVPKEKVSQQQQQNKSTKQVLDLYKNEKSKKKWIIDESIPTDLIEKNAKSFSVVSPEITEDCSSFISINTKNNHLKQSFTSSEKYETKKLEKENEKNRIHSSENHREKSSKRRKYDSHSRKYYKESKKDNYENRHSKTGNNRRSRDRDESERHHRSDEKFKERHHHSNNNRKGISIKTDKHQHRREFDKRERNQKKSSHGDKLARRSHTEGSPRGKSVDSSSRSSREEKEIRKSSELNQEEEPWICEVCNFDDATQRITHIKSHPFHCQSCHLAFKTEAYFVNHLTRKHKDIRNQHHCLLCELSFDTEEEYQRHLDTREHTHLESVEKNTINTLFTLLTGQPCPVLGLVEMKPEWLPNQAGTVHFYHQATPLSLALQYLKVHHDISSFSTVPSAHSN